MTKIYCYFDIIENKSKDYLIENEKHHKLYNAFMSVLNNECPPNRRDYCCMIDDTDEERCKECWIRYALNE